MKPWKITWAGQTFTGDDLIAADLIDLQLILDDGWRSCDPWTGPLHLAALIAVYTARTTGADPGIVREQLKSVPARELLAALDVAVDLKAA
jgi:hypothetical protein